VIQGLRLLPFVAELPNFNCSTCQNGDKRTNMLPQPIEVRRRQGCGYLPLAPHANTASGLPLGVDLGTDEDGRPTKPAHCPGYLIALPEVQEAVRLRPHWLKGGPAGLREYVRGSGASDDLTAANDAQAILDGAVTLKQNHDSEERARKAEEARRG
jgi:hypothetical protein